jgi:hypothetical protein
MKTVFVMNESEKQDSFKISRLVGCPKERLQLSIVKGEIDVEMLPFLDRINSIPNYQTLYCCSGHGNVGYVLFSVPNPEGLAQKLRIAYNKRDWPIAPLPDDYVDFGIEIPYAVVGPCFESNETINIAFNNLTELDNIITAMETMG